MPVAAEDSSFDLWLRSQLVEQHGRAVRDALPDELAELVMSLPDQSELFGGVRLRSTTPPSIVS